MIAKTAGSKSQNVTIRTANTICLLTGTNEEALMAKIITTLSIASSAILGFLYLSKRKNYDELKSNMFEKEFRHLDLRSDILHLAENINTNDMSSEEIISEIHNILDDDIKYF